MTCVLFVSGETFDLCSQQRGLKKQANGCLFIGPPVPSPSQIFLACLVQEAIQLDGEIFFALLRKASPIAYRHLKRYKIDPILYMTEWFMCIFSRTLPWCSVLRVWDMFFCEGKACPQPFWGMSVKLCMPTSSIAPLQAREKVAFPGAKELQRVCTFARNQNGLFITGKDSYAIADMVTKTLFAEGLEGTYLTHTCQDSYVTESCSIFIPKMI